MNYLGIKLGDIDDIVISHNHYDHNGGVNEEEGTFIIGNSQPALDGIKVYTPDTNEISFNVNQFLFQIQQKLKELYQRQE